MSELQVYEVHPVERDTPVNFLLTILFTMLNRQTEAISGRAEEEQHSLIQTPPCTP